MSTIHQFFKRLVFLFETFERSKWQYISSVQSKCWRCLANIPYFHCWRTGSHWFEILYRLNQDQNGKLHTLVMMEYCYWRRGSWLLEKWSYRVCRRVLFFIFLNKFTVFITIWLTVPKYPYVKWQWIFYFLRRCFLSSITAKTFSGLDCIEYVLDTTIRNQTQLT
jgi:hypothetical protein